MSRLLLFFFYYYHYSYYFYFLPLSTYVIIYLIMLRSGGFYDHVPPPVTGIPSPDDISCVDCGKTPFNFTRLGIRVPMIAISPWAEKGKIVHVPASAAGAYEHTSLGATLAALVPGFGGPMTARAAWAYPLHPLWEDTNMTSPRTDCPPTLPDPPAMTPSQVGIPHDGSLPVSDLQKLLLLLAEGAAGTVEGRDMTLEAPTLLAKLEKEGALANGATAGYRAIARMQEMLAHRVVPPSAGGA